MTKNASKINGIDELGREIYNHRQFGKCEVVKKYADAIIIKTRAINGDDCFYKITSTGISHVPNDSKIITL